AGRQEEAAETSEADAPVNPRSLREELPPVSAKMNSMLNKLMMSPEYGIKRNLGIFNFIKYFQKDGQEQVAADFCTTTMNSHIEKMQEFITAVKTLIQLAPEPYKARIANEMDSKFKFLRTVAGWTTHQLKLIHLNVQELPQPHIVQDLIPYTRAVYRLVLQLYYFGDAKIPKLIKEVYEDEADCPGAPQEKLYESAKEAITNWLYIQTEVIQKLYPLLMRMCSDTFEEYPDFFKTKTGSILKFVGLHKYDLLLPEKPKEAETKPAEEPKPKAAITRGARDGIVETGIRLLDQLFPQAGFARLESHPDFYPYFQPLYKFADGFNVLHPENPLQTTIVLLRIVEDCLQGCRNIQFNEAEQNSTGNGRPDSMEKAIDEWSGYRETVFERLYCEPLNHLVNEVYSQTDFENSRMGKKFLNSLLWQTRYHFLPNFKFEQVLLERPADDSKMQPLFFRTDFVRKFLMGT
ncbi:MAG: hypothetical protein K2H09_04155, partial [Treponemataceae bacterium]|nr:hypothetical protein [Treponemataceae bacterium]